MDLDEIQARILDVTTNLANTLGADPKKHGMLRGTFEGALAEAQGAELIKPKFFTPASQSFKHFENMRGAANSLANNLSQFRELLMKLRAIDPKAADVADTSFRPLTETASLRVQMANEVEELIIEINTTGNATRLTGVPLNQSRDAAGLVSNQLQQFNMGLVPKQLAQSFSTLMDRIRQLPTTLSEARDQVRNIALMVSSVATAAARMARSALARLSEAFEATLDVVAEFASRFTVFIPPVPTDLLKSVPGGGGSSKGA
jgi:hypothetical protein